MKNRYMNILSEVMEKYRKPFIDALSVETPFLNWLTEQREGKRVYVSSEGFSPPLGRSEE